MKSLTPEDKLLKQQLKKYTNRSRWPSEVLKELTESINAVAVDHRCSILATRFKYSETILHRAACKGEIDVFKLVIDSVLVESKFDLLKVKNAEGNTPLHLMGRSKFGDNIQHVLAGLSQENVTELLQMQNCEKETLLHKASKADTSAPLEYLLSHVKPKDRFDLLKVHDEIGRTPLYCSVIDIDESENKLQRIMDALSSEEYFQLLQLKANNGYTVLHTRSALSSLSELKLLLEHKNLSLECKTHLFQLQDVDGDTLLHNACCWGSLEVVKYIVDECPPDVRLHLLKTTNMDMRNPLHVAVLFQPAILIKPLLANLPPSEIAAILSMKDDEGSTALTSAVEYNDISVIQEITNLIPTDHAMSILNITNNENKTAMEIAVGADNQSAVSLLQKCADRVKSLSTDDITSTPHPVPWQQDGQLGVNFPPSYSSVRVTKKHSHGQQLSSVPQPNLASESTQLPYPPAHQSLPHAVDLSHAAVNMVGSVPSSLSGFLQQNTATADFYDLTPVPPQALTGPPHTITSSTSTSQPTQHLSAVSDVQRSGTSFETHTSEYTPVEQFPGPPEDGTIELMNASSSSTTSHHFLPNVLGQFNADNSLVQSGSKRAAPLETTTQPVHVAKTARVDHANGKVDDHTLKIMYQGQGYILPFKPDDTVEQLTKRIQKATSSSCVVESSDEFKYTEDVTLDQVKSPFVIVLDDFRILVTGDVQKRNGESSNSMTETRQSSTEQQTFGRVSSMREVIELFSFVHERMKEGKTVNGALKLAKKSRKTIDRFMNIYYLHGQDREKMEELERNWVRDDKPQALPGLDKMAKKEINWNQLLKCFADGSVADFRLKKDR